MKKFALIPLAILITLSLFAVKDWKAYTNTTYITSMIKIDSSYVTATWGGMQTFDFSQKKSENIPELLTTMNGLNENFIKDVKYADNVLFIATNSNGIQRYSNGEFIMPIQDIIGLISNEVNKMIIQDTLIFVATKKGISVFYDNPQNYFPILIKNFDTTNGLSSDNITSLELFKNHLYCGSANGIDFISLDSLNVVTNSWHHLYTSNSPLPDNFINDISATDDFLAIGTKQGILIVKNLYQMLGWRVYEKGNSIFPVFSADKRVFYSYGYWDEEHLDIIKPDGQNLFTVISEPLTSGIITHYNEPNISNKIKGFNKFGDKYIIYTWGDGFYTSENLDNWTTYKANCPIANSIFRLKFDNENKLWISTGHHKWEPSTTGTKGVSSFDGTNWTNYSCYSSPLISNNIISIEVDNNNNVYFGTRYSPQGNDMNWGNGISIYNQSSDVWDTLFVSSNFIIDMYFDKDKKEKWITCYDGGVSVLDEYNQILTSFEIYGSPDQKVVKTLPAMNKVFFGFWFDGIKYWNGSDYPDYNQFSNWIEPPANELTHGKIYDIAYRKSEYGEEQVWFASANGLFMFNGDKWFWYGPIQKKRVLASSYNWEPDQIEEAEYHTPEYWYVVGQERLYGSVITYPTALFVDPFGSIWIGTHDHGITRFYPDKDLYINYYMDNSPLLSNSINDFAYNPDTGELYIATPKGLNSVYIGILQEKNKVKKLNKTIAYPNPFSPYKGDVLRIVNTSEPNMPKGNTYCKIYDLNGNEIIKLHKNDYQEFDWDGKNKAGKLCAPGIYFYLVYTPDGQIDKNKFVIKR